MHQLLFAHCRPIIIRRMARESMQYDVVVVGAGPAGPRRGDPPEAARRRTAASSVCVLEKGSEIGAHILSGAVMDPRALDELIPDWKAKGAPLNYPGHRGPLPVPHRTSCSSRCRISCCRRASSNHGNYVVSLGNVCRWLGKQAEALGVEIFPGFAAAGGALRRAMAGQGRRHRRHGHRQERREDRRATSPAWSCTRKYTFFAEGCRGHLGKAARGEASSCAKARSAGLRHRPEGAVGDQAREAPARPGHPHRGLAARRATPTAARSSTTWRTTRSRSASSSASGYANPYLSPLRGIPALQDPSGDPRLPRGRQAHLPTARAPSRPAACSRCRSWSFRAAR